MLLARLLRIFSPPYSRSNVTGYIRFLNDAGVRIFAMLLAWVMTLLGSRLPAVQDFALSVPPFRRVLLRSLRSRFYSIIQMVLRSPPPDPIAFEALGYHVPPAAARTLHMATLHAVAKSFQAENSDDPLPPTTLLPSMNNVLLQTEERRGAKWLESVASALASHMCASFLAVDAMMLASMLAEALGGTPESHLSWIGPTNVASFGSHHGRGVRGTVQSRAKWRRETRLRLAWEALREALYYRQAKEHQGTVVFIRTADSLLCSSWEAYDAFTEVFGPNSGEAAALEGMNTAGNGERKSYGPTVFIAAVILAEAPGSTLSSSGQHRRRAEDSALGPAKAGFGSMSPWKQDFNEGMESDVDGLGPLDGEIGLAGLLLSLSRLAEAGEPKPDPRSLLPRAFPTLVKLEPPPRGPDAARHYDRLKQDEGNQMESENFSRARAVGASTGVVMPPRDSGIYALPREFTSINTALSREEWERIVSWAVSFDAMQKRLVQKHDTPTSGEGTSILLDQEPIAMAIENGGTSMSLVSSIGGVVRKRFGSSFLTRHGLAGTASKQEGLSARSGVWWPVGYLLRVFAYLEGALGRIIGTSGLPSEPSDGIGKDIQERSQLNEANVHLETAGRFGINGVDKSTAEVQLSEAAVRYGLAMLRSSGGSLRPVVNPENMYEKQLLSDVLVPEDLGKGFSDVGALEDAKRALKEAVQLPLQRPELFHSGALARPPTGVLLFGPPGTGKTLLARAAAAESGAAFLEISLSSLSSKWYGDSTKLVRAAFSLADKLSPCVLFIDEVDALLGRREGGGREHEATRELKNEFFMRWDGIRGTAERRVMVLGATNRPFDLDEAVLRRFSVRVSVGLPSREARRQILGVILVGQALAPDVDLESIAESTEGFTGADLRQLCVAAAMRPVREEIDRGVVQETSLDDNALENELGPGGGDALGDSLLSITTPPMRDAFKSAIAMIEDTKEGSRRSVRAVAARDFEAAMREGNPSVDPDSAVIQELNEWNAKYGSMGARTALDRRMSYYT